MSQTPEPSCEFCNKKGLAVLPVRYAIAAPQSSAPPLSGSFKVDVAPILGKAHYTTRLLRSGYLYVYDEARKRWEEYFVTPDSHYFKLPARGPNVVKPALPQAFACARNGHAPLASCITIRDPKNAKVVWFGFSDVEWTDAVLKKHESADYRARHMQKLVISGGKATPGAPHTQPIAQVDKTVTEYALEARAGAKDFAWSPFAYTPRPAQAATLIAAAERLAPGAGVVLALPDPAGITQELAALMTWQFSAFTERQDFRRPLAVSSAIAQIKTAVASQAEAAEIEAAERLANQATADTGLGMLFDSVQKNIEKMRTVTPVELDRAAAAAWGKYTTKYDDAARARWQADFDAALGKFDTESIVPLAQAHVLWMASPRLSEYFACNYDPHHAASGAVYTKQVQLCIAGTQDKKACFDLYADWLKGDLTDRKNLLLRALVLNQEDQAKAISDATKASVDWRSLPWDGLIGNFAKAIERVMASTPDVLGNLLIQIGGPLAHLMREAAEGPVRQALVAVGAVSGQPVVRVEITGGKKAFRAMLIRELLASSGQIATPRQMQRAVALELKRLEIRGDTLQGTDKKHWLLMIDPTQARAMPKNLGAQQRAQWLAQSLRTPEQIEALNLAGWRARVNQGGVIVKGASPFVFGVTAGLFQFAALSKLNEDVDKSMAHEKTENQWRRGAGIAALAGTTAEFMGMAMGKIPVANLSYGRGVVVRTLARGASLVGRGAGLGAALVMAWRDGIRAKEAFDQKQMGLMWAYAGSAAIGVAATVALIAGWTGIGLILVGLLFAVAILIEYIKDNKLQDWLERCLWGKLAGQRYADIDVEMRELKLAIGN